MATDTAKFTLRIDAELLKKFRFVADYNARSANRELEVLMKKHIAEFEKENGKITFDWFFFVVLLVHYLQNGHCIQKYSGISLVIRHLYAA